ncbi:hypothetical protein A2U01_0069559, partial [Trifolium medium]|nr:hypothetical protein [Trifolium medium]
MTHNGGSVEGCSKLEVRIRVLETTDHGERGGGGGVPAENALTP